MPAIAVVSDRAKKRLKSFHPWIFSNEIERKPLSNPGEVVEIQDQSGRYLATGYYNPHTLIAIRVLAFHRHFDLPGRIQSAFQRRHQIYPDNVYRLIYSESDGLPGLIVDRYEQTLVVQILTAGMDLLKESLVAELLKVVQPERVLLRNDSPYRKLEGLSPEIQWIKGEVKPEEIIETDALKFVIDFEQGQKTGFFLDQRQNRKRLKEYGAAENMLDVFCYTGSWSLYGAAAGIKRITAVDSSEGALVQLQRNADLNDHDITAVAADGPEYLRSVASSSERFDRIVLDPPAFCKSKRHLAAALRAYREVNLRAMKSLSRNGILFTCSCSQPVTPEIFLNMLHQAAVASGRQFYLRDLLFQPPDHPILMGFPESHYLKCAILEVA
jgi:23S rRNA (cytosine1962-C5)-methyltransferase